MRPVLVTTEFRGVFFGYLDSEEGETVTLRKCRNCLVWSSAMRGFLGLAVFGPDAQCKIGPEAARVILHKVTSIIDVEDTAVERWMQA